MSKICPCRRDLIRHEIAFAINNWNRWSGSLLLERADLSTEAIEKVLESDCVCEKKVSCSEIPNNSEDLLPTPVKSQSSEKKEEISHDRSKTVGLHIGNGHIELNSNYFAPTKEKQEINQVTIYD